MTIDQSILDVNTRVAIAPAALTQSSLALQYTVAGLHSQVTLSFTLSNTLTAAGVVVVTPPSDFPGFAPSSVRIAVTPRDVHPYADAEI